jgi:hypothetical protein
MHLVLTPAHPWPGQQMRGRRTNLLRKTPSQPLIPAPKEFYQLDDNYLNPIGDNLDLLIQTQINADCVFA